MGIISLSESAAKGALTYRARWVLRGLVLFHIYVLFGCVFWWGTHLQPLIEPVGGYVRSVGVNQRWGMFTPNPTGVTNTIYAMIRFSDGGSARWDLPTAPGFWPISEMTFSRHFKLNERIWKDSRKRFWPALTRLIAKSVSRPGVEVVSVELYRSWVTVTSPYGDGAPKASSPVVFHRERFDLSLEGGSKQ